jgi:uncharacterized protein YneF (UPF0154 family)
MNILLAIVISIAFHLVIGYAMYLAFKAIDEEFNKNNN